MKRTIAILLTAVMLLTASACGKNEPTVVVETPAPSVEITPVPVAEPESTPEQLPEEPAEEISEPAAEPEEDDGFDMEMFLAACGLEGEDINELYDAIGMPDSVEEYTSSCMGDGEDGQLHYPGFDVYTYRENGLETVYLVEKN